MYPESDRGSGILTYDDLWQQMHNSLDLELSPNAAHQKRRLLSFFSHVILSANGADREGYSCVPE